MYSSALVIAVAIALVSKAIAGGHYHRPPPYRPPPPSYRPPPPAYRPPPPPQVECGISYSPNHCERCEAKPDQYTKYDTVDVGEYWKSVSVRDSPDIDLRIEYRNPEAEKAVNKGSKVVHESPAKSHRHPWHAAVIKGTDLAFICSGTLVSAKIVVTAASCVYGKNAGDLVVRLGQLDMMSSFEPTEPIYEGKLSELNVHPHYDPYKGGYDVALLFLQNPIDFWKFHNIRPICLPHYEDYSTDTCIVAGWHAAPKKLFTKTLLIELYGHSETTTSSYTTAPPTTENYPESTPSPDYSTTSTTSDASGRDGGAGHSYDEKPGDAYFQQSNSKVLQEACVKFVEKHQCSLSEGYHDRQFEQAGYTTASYEQPTYQPPPPTPGYTQPPYSTEQTTYQPSPPPPGYSQPQDDAYQTTYQPPPPTDGYTQPPYSTEQTTYQPPPPPDGYTQPPYAPQQPPDQRAGNDAYMDPVYDLRMLPYQTGYPQPEEVVRTARGYAQHQENYKKPDYERCLVGLCYEGKPCVGDLGSGIACIRGKYQHDKCNDKTQYQAPPYHQQQQYSTTPAYGKGVDETAYQKENVIPDDKYSEKAQYPQVAEEYDEYYEAIPAEFVVNGPAPKSASTYDKTIKVAPLIPEKDYCKKVYVLAAIVSKKAKCSGYGAQPDAVLVQSIEPVLDFIKKAVHQH